MVNKVVRRLAPRNRRRSRANTKEVIESTTDVEKSQPHSAHRGGRGRPGNGYFMERGFYDPYGFGCRGRGRGGRGRGRFRQRRGGANKENQPQDNSEEKKLGELNSTGENFQNKPAISEQVNQSS